MESPPSCSAWSGIISSEDSGLLITSSSISSGIEYPESEDEKSYCDPDEDSLCDESNFNTVRKVEWHHKTIDPPLEFQDTPPAAFQVEGRRALTPPPLSSPRRSLSTSRLSSSHNSLSVPLANKVDDSSFITSAMSHDMLTDLYNVPLDSDIYTLPIDTIKPRIHHKKHHRHGKRRRRHTAVECEIDCQKQVDKRSSKRHSAPGQGEPVHMTLQEVRQFLHTLYSGGESNSEAYHRDCKLRQQEKRKHRSKHKPQSICSEEKAPKTTERSKKSSGVKNSFSHLLKRTLCNMFRVKKPPRQTEGVLVLGVPKVPPFAERALPPLPEKVTVPTLLSHNDEAAVDFASSIEKVKDYGWYWGPISGEAAEKILSNEPDGSFIVRDSSDHHYIFSLTFRLNGCVRHVRIEHDQGNFSFGSCTKFKSQTIVEFIETAVEHSRSGRYLFFLHRRPILGPMRVQLLHPVSRFKHVQSLQHMCRFVIVKTVRRDLISSLPLPRRLIDYLSSPHYYSEQLIDHQDQPSSPPSLHLFSFMPPN